MLELTCLFPYEEKNNTEQFVGFKQETMYWYRNTYRNNFFHH